MAQPKTDSSKWFGQTSLQPHRLTAAESADTVWQNRRPLKRQLIGEVSMSRLLSVKDWKDGTSVFGKPRSKELLDVDVALKAYEDYLDRPAPDRRVVALRRIELIEALNKWKKKEGPGDAWKKSIRNKKQAVERLTALLNGGDTEQLWGRSPPELHDSFNNARLGVLYLLGHLDVSADVCNVLLEGGLAVVGPVLSYQGGKIEDGGLGMTAVDAAQNYYNSAIIPVSAVLSAAATATIDPELNALKLAKPEEKRLIGERTRELFSKVVEKTIELCKEKFGGLQPLGAAVKNLINLCCKFFLSTVGAGLVSGGIDTLKGLVQTIDATMTRVGTYIRGRGVAISAGHPAIVVEGIKNAMNDTLLKGLWSTMKGVGNIGLAFGTGGVGLIVGVVTALVEMVVKLVWRMTEALHMKKIFSEARKFWDQKTETTGLHMTPFAFNEWFRKSVKYHPALSILTLNSGICGDKMVWLSMFQGQDFQKEIDAKEFLHGAAYIDSLKPFGVKYLKDVGYAFRGKSAQSSSILKFATETHQANNSGAGNAWEKFAELATA